MKPTLEEVKEHYKDAKVVKCIDSEKVFSLPFGRIDMNHNTIYGDDIDYKTNRGYGYISLWDDIKGYAEIIEYKTKPTQINIDIPQGYEIDKDNSTFECIKFKKIEKQFPNSWEEYLSSQPLGVKVMFESKFNSLPETYKALRKLELLRDCYNDGWVADWTDSGSKECIIYMNDKLDENCTQGYKQFLNFKTAELRDKFLENFKDIIEIAKPLL